MVSKSYKKSRELVKEYFHARGFLTADEVKEKLKNKKKKNYTYTI